MKGSEFNKGFYRGRNGALFISSIFWMIVILIILMCSCSSNLSRLFYGIYTLLCAVLCSAAGTGACLWPPRLPLCSLGKVLHITFLGLGEVAEPDA